jgi:hypothetical protein
VNPLRRLARALGAGRRVGAQGETAGDEPQNAGVLMRRGPDRPRPRAVSGPELRALETLDTVLPSMAATIERARPMVARVLDLGHDDVDALDSFDESDERALLANLRALAWEAHHVTGATNVLRAGVDLIDADELQLEVL